MNRGFLGRLGFMVAHGELAGFLEQLDRRRARLTALAECGSGELRDEARTVGEELLAAREELRVQQEELVAAQAVAALTSANYNDIVASTDTAHLVTDLEGLILGANG